MEIKTFHGFEDFCVEKFENTDEWYYGIYLHNNLLIL